MPTRLRGLRLAEISLVDEPANKGARVSLYKRADPPAKTAASDAMARQMDAIRKVAEARIAEATASGAATVAALAKMREAVIARKREHRDAIAKMVADHLGGQTDFVAAVREYLEREMRWKVVEAVEPLISALRESVLGAANELTGEAREAKVRENVESFLSAITAVLGKYRDNPSGAGQQAEDIQMTDTTKGDLDSQVAAITKRAEAAEAGIAALTKAIEAQGGTVAKAVDGALSVTYPQPEDFIEIGGERVLKSAVPAAVVKQMTAAAERIAKLEADREAADLAKRAEADLPNLVGSAEVRGAIVKAVDGIADEKVRAEAHKSLAAASAAIGERMKPIGKAAPDTGGAADGSAIAKLQAKADEIRKADSKLTAAQAFAKATRENPALYDEYLEAGEGR